MGARMYTFQFKETISISRCNFIERVVRCDLLGRKDLRVLLQLMTHLDGMNFKSFNKKAVAAELNMSKGDVTKAIDNLIEYGILQKGSSSSVDDGYRLEF